MSGRGWVAALDGGVRWAVVVCAIGWLAGSHQAFVAEYARLTAGGQAALIGLGLVHGLVAALLINSVTRWWLELGVVVVTAALLVVFLLGRPEATEWSFGWWPTGGVVLVQSWVLAFGGRWRWWIGGVGTAVFAAIRLAGALLSGDGWRFAIADIVSGTSLALMLILGLAAVRRVAEHSDRAEVDRVAAVRAERAQCLAESGAREVARFLHDEVSHALRAIALARGLDSGQAQTLAGRVASRLRSGSSPMPGR